MTSAKTPNSYLLLLGLSTLAFCLLCGLGVARGADTRNTDPRQLAGTYHDTYAALIGYNSEIWKVEKYLTIRATEDPNRFYYEQCWRRMDGGDWNPEKGGLVVTSSPDAVVEFAVAEAGPAPAEGTSGIIHGRMLSRDAIDIAYLGLGRGIVFRSQAKRTNVADDKASCPRD